MIKVASSYSVIVSFDEKTLHHEQAHGTKAVLLQRCKELIFQKETK
jgi:hypothetical protein